MTIAAIVLAAGRSRRMGRPKMLLPWGETTVIGAVVNMLETAGLDEIWTITGGARCQVESALRQTGTRILFNPKFTEGEMLSSLQTGLGALPASVSAALIVLGDNPHMQAGVVRQVIATHQRSGAVLVAPSYHMRRGHPWLVARALWPEILALRAPQTPRDFFNQFADEIHYVDVNTPSILQDLDTPEDYSQNRLDQE